MDNPINAKLVERALDIALKGYQQNTAVASLRLEFFNEPAHMIEQAVQYAYQGGTHPAAQQAQQTLKANTPKAKVRKTMIMLKVNYKEAGEDAVTDCLTDLQHYCMAKGIDYLTCEERAQGHFLTENEGARYD